MQRKQSFINDKRRVSYLSAVYNRIYRGQSVLIEGEYGVGKTRFLELLNPKKLQGVWVESLFNVHEILASILQGLNYEAVATYRRTPYHLKLIRNLTDYYIVIDEANDIDKRVWPYLKRIMDAHVPIVRNFLTRVKKKMQALSVGRHVRSTTEGFELRETIDPYNSHFEAEKCDIDANNTWFWNINNKIPVC
jgi:hypothetical protein